MIRKSDFYYGSLLSVLINKQKEPFLIASEGERRIYLLGKNNNGSKVFVKYVSKPTKRKNDIKTTWNFNFGKKEIAEIKKMRELNENTQFALICADSDNWNDSEIAILGLSDILKCLDIDYDRENFRVAIQLKKRSRNFEVYGTGVSSDRPVLIKKDYISMLSDI